MHARVITIQTYEGKLDELITQVRDAVLPAATKQPGFRGAVVLGNPSTNTATMTSYWHHRAEEYSSQHSQYFEEVFREIATVFGYKEEIETYEVLFAQWPHEAVNLPPTTDTNAAPAT
jgi:hypothetical protein